MEIKAAVPPNPNLNPNQSPLCNECGLNPSKYKCPGCSIRSCSLPCVKSHKQRTSCTGKRLRTQFVPLSQFDDNLLISDYNLLEEAKRVTESAQRLRDDGLFGNPHFLPHKLRSLKGAAGRRKIHLLLLPKGMSKREKNQSRYNPRKNSIFWTIEWQFHSTDVVLIDNGVDENMILSPVIEKHLKVGQRNHKLKPFFEEQFDHLKFFIRKSPKGPKLLFRELDVKAPISQQLAKITIIEYPIIHVVLPSSNYDFEVVKDANPFHQEPTLKEPSSSENLPSPKGVLFREEEIAEEEEEEDVISSDSHISDILKLMNPELADNFRLPNVVRPLLKDNDACCGSNMDEMRVFKDTAFDFEQDLRDAYSGLIGQVNPDGFLDLEEGGFVGEGRMSDEELEEGEIRGF